MNAESVLQRLKNGSTSIFHTKRDPTIELKAENGKIDLTSIQYAFKDEEWEEVARKTLNEWAEEDGIVILDPDGFDRKDPQLMTRLFTYDEFQKGLYPCTIAIIKGGKLDKWIKENFKKGRNKNA